MQRASYRVGVRWIADNDESGVDTRDTPEARERVAAYPSSLLLAELFNVEPSRVAIDVMRIREREARAAGAGSAEFARARDMGDD